MTGKPKTSGFYWAHWNKACAGTRDGDELAPSHEHEIVHVVDALRGTLMVMVPGVEKWQPLENFHWGAFIAEERLIAEPQIFTESSNEVTRHDD